jgi:hypothetical protein
MTMSKSKTMAQVSTALVKKSAASFGRRSFLRGAGGVALALPALETFAARRAHAAGKKIYTVFMCQQNGAVPEQFYPKSLGPLSPATMTGTAVEDLQDLAADLLVVRGIDWAFGDTVGCGHSSGCNTALTASKATGKSNRSLPTGQSADLRIATGLGREPLNLYAGVKDSYLGDAFAYGPTGQVRPADNNPWNVYQRMMGMGTMAPSTPTQPGAPVPMDNQKDVARQKSINDILRTQIDQLLRRTDLSSNDRRRLDLHLHSVRDLELMMTKPVPATGGDAELVGTLMKLKDKPDANDLIEDAVKAQLSLIALAFATDQTQVATLQIGGGNDHTRYMVDGVLAPPYHFVSHHVLSDGDGGTTIPNAVALHQGITRIHARFFKHLVQQLKSYQTADGRPLLEDCAAVWMNSLSDGPPHGSRNVPHVIAGTAGGFLKKGVYVDAAASKNNKFLNTMITAAGVRKPSGDPVDDFGDAGLAPGLLTALLA